MKVTKKAIRFDELSKKSELNAKEQKEIASLRRFLTAKGLDPRHNGLMDRAIVLENMSVVEQFIEAAKRAEHTDKVSESAQYTLDALKARLKNLGLENLNRRYLQSLIKNIKQNAREADRLKRSCKTRAPHKVSSTDDELFVDDDETDEEDSAFMVAEAATI